MLLSATLPKKKKWNNIQSKTASVLMSVAGYTSHPNVIKNVFIEMRKPC